MIEQEAFKCRIKARARDFTHLLAKSGGGSREAVTEQKIARTASMQGLGIAQIHGQNLADVSRHRAKSLLMPRELKG